MKRRKKRLRPSEANPEARYWQMIRWRNRRVEKSGALTEEMTFMEQRRYLDRKRVMKALAIILLFISSHGKAQCLDLDIMVVGDFSGSVQGHEDYVFDAFESFSGIATEEKNIRIGLMLFNEDSEVTISLTKNHSIFQTVPRGRTATGSTDIENAIQQAANELLKSHNNSRKLIILISDGQITEGGDENQTLFIAKQLPVLGVGICSVLIKSPACDAEFMREIASGCYVESDYENLSEELQNLDLCL